LFYHDSTISGGHTQLRGMKFTELEISEDGTITPMIPYQTDEEKLSAASLMRDKGADLETIVKTLNLDENLMET